MDGHPITGRQVAQELERGSGGSVQNCVQSLGRLRRTQEREVWGCLVDRAKTCIVDKGGNRSHEARKGYAVAIDPDEDLLAEPVEVGAVAHVEVEAVSDDEEEGRV